MTDTDPAVRALSVSMADTVGGTDTDGLRRTMFSDLTASLSTLQATYALAATENNEAPSGMP